MIEIEIEIVENNIEMINKELKVLRNLGADDKKRKLDIEETKLQLLADKFVLLSELKTLLGIRW